MFTFNSIMAAPTRLMKPVRNGRWIGNLLWSHASIHRLVPLRLVPVSRGASTDAVAKAKVGSSINPCKSTPSVVGSTDKAEKISKAMKAYLERTQAYETFMSAEIEEFEIGKRHLASIMGVNADNLTQEEIDKAIEYLLPSALFDKKARPFLKHPADVLPRRKAAQFGVDGRPFHTFFYTGKPNYIQALHDASMKIEDLKKLEDSQIARGVQYDSSQTLALSGSRWLEKQDIQKKLDETLSDDEYKMLLAILEHVAKMPYAATVKDFVFQFRQIFQNVHAESTTANLIQDEDGRLYQVAEGARKAAKAKVKLWSTGTGKMTVNGRTLVEYFPRMIDREQVIFPLHFVEKLQLVDFEATVSGGGCSGQAGALRLALSLALRSFVDKDTIEKMRLAGLLTRDPRTVERQKPGQQGARRKYTWKKR